MTEHTSGSSSAKRLFLIDGFSNIFRAFYAIRNLSNSKGDPTNAVFGFLQILRKLLKDENPAFIGIALDVSRKTVRSEKFPEYKANRSPMPEDLRPQIPLIREVIEAYRIPILEMPKYEADDVLGTLGRAASEEGYEVVLVSADKDLFQLVSPQVSLFHTGRNKLYDPALVEEDFGVPPSQVADVLALMGDASDNVPGVKGIGEKGAKNLIREYGSVENLLDRAGEIQRKSYREGLREHRQMAELSKDLVTIHCDLPIPFEPEKLRRDPPDVDLLRELLRKLEFFSLLEELEGAPTAQEPLPSAKPIQSTEQWKTVTQSFGASIVVVAVAAGEEAPIGVVVGDGDGADFFYADFRGEGELASVVRETLGGWFRDSHRKLIGHDLKEVLRLVERGTAVEADLFDTMLVSYVLHPSFKHGLEELALERLRHSLVTTVSAGWVKTTPPEATSEGLLAYAGERAAAAHRLAQAMTEELEAGEVSNSLRGIYDNIEKPLLPVLVAMEERGVLLDTAFLEAMSLELEKEIAALEGEIYELAGETFNINSPQQLGVILFEKLGYPVVKRTRKTKSYATGAEVLEQLASQGFPLPERILRYREFAKLKSTYVDALPALVAEDGRIHTRFNQAVAATGRLSSARPNLQNIPIRTELGQRIRRAFVAAPGHQLLVADYSQVELRVLAHIAGEEAMLEAFRAGQDIHQATAASVFGIAAEMVAPEQRRAAKTINFGILYGMSAFGLARNLGIPNAQAKQFIETYMSRYAGVKAYVEGTIAEAEKDGKVETLDGRIRWLPEMKSKNRAVRENAHRMAINARIQGTAADIMKLAIIAVHQRLEETGSRARLLLTVHDELVLEVPDAEVHQVAELVRTEMEGVRKLDAPLLADVGVGPTWFEAK